MTIDDLPYYSQFHARVGLFAGSRAQIVYYTHLLGDPPSTRTLFALPGYYDDVNQAYLLANELNVQRMSPSEAREYLIKKEKPA